MCFFMIAMRAFFSTFDISGDSMWLNPWFVGAVIGLPLGFVIGILMGAGRRCYIVKRRNMLHKIKYPVILAPQDTCVFLRDDRRGRGGGGGEAEEEKDR